MLPRCAEFADLEIDFLMPSTNPPKSNHQLRQCQNTIKQGDDNEPTKSWLPHACLVRTSYDRLHAKLSEVVYHGSDTSIRVMLPSQDSLNSFIESYFENFSPLFPILSKAGFNADREHCLLVLSVCTIGVSFFGETQLQTLCLMRSLLRKHLDGLTRWNKVGTETELATELWYQQVRFLAHVIFSCSESYEMLDYAQKAKGVFVMSQEQRLRGLDRESFKPDMTTWMQSEEELEAWRWRESVKRTIFAVWAVDTQGSLLYDLPPMVTLRARQLPLPAPEGLWEARTAKEWNAERLKQDIDQNPLSLDDWVEILYRDDDDDIPVMTTLSSFSRFLAILAITQDIGEYVRASKKFARLHHKHTHEEETRITTSEWTALLTRCHDVLCQTPCFEESWPLHRQLISQAYHCTMMSMQVTYKDLYGFVGYKASSREVDVTRYRLSSWMLERPGGIQTALVHAVRILVHMRIDKPKNPHAALMVCIATLTIWVFLDLRLGSPSPSDEAMDMGRCPACRGDIRASLDRCCLKGTFGHDLSTFEIDLIRGTVSVERLVHESCDLLKTVTFWQISNGIISSLTYHYQLTKGSTNSARL
ncbi:hypothetical protein H2204_013072 [Knufia peltigerae]|uniref:Xylanolytic transcriptional activator regulatory domain-containing protein n=1 Tax=Knufia peltigerae TaxID=1002370 RepID=A0AA38XRG6_9EURO|nr:hypothetical protein H2204_013072 [Knufia peltigerae]